MKPLLKHAELARRLGVGVIPTLLMIERKRERARVEGSARVPRDTSRVQ